MIPACGALLEELGGPGGVGYQYDSIRITGRKGIEYVVYDPWRVLSCQVKTMQHHPFQHSSGSKLPCFVIHPLGHPLCSRLAGDEMIAVRLHVLAWPLFGVMGQIVLRFQGQKGKK